MQGPAQQPCSTARIVLVSFIAQSGKGDPDLSGFHAGYFQARCLQTIDQVLCNHASFETDNVDVLPKPAQARDDLLSIR